MTHPETTAVTVTRHRIEASATVIFDPDRMPVIVAKGGRIHGCQFALSEIYLTMTALTTATGEVLTYTGSIPKIDRMVAGNGDDLDASDWRFLSVAEAELPEECAPTLQLLRTAVHAFHPDLTLKSAAE